MKTKWTLLLMAGLGATWPVAAQAQGGDLQPLAVRNLTGNMHIFQSIPDPCPDLNGDLPVVGGRFEIAPAEGHDVAGGKLFVLTRGTVTIQPFTVSVSCLGRDEIREYSALSVQVVGAVSFLAVPSGPGVYTFAIPPEDVLFHEAAIVNGGPETSDSGPRDPVTGTIDLDHGTVQMRVVVPTRIHIDVLGDFDGAVTTDLSGTIVFPDTDGDGVPDRSDNCRMVANADQGAVASPIVRAPADVTLGSCGDTRLGRALGADACENGAVSVTNDAPSPYPLGSTIVTWRAEDARGRVGTDTQQVTIDDRTPPVFTSVPIEITMTDCGPAELGLPTATDDCGGAGPTLTSDAPARFLAGSTVVTWTATDVSGNQAAATQTVTVNDLVPPEVSCVPGRNPAGHGHGGGGFFQVFATDHCAELPTIRLGGFALSHGETIKITETSRPGVRLVGVMGPEAIRHFHVGGGEAVVTATERSGNLASADCR